VIRVLMLADLNSIHTQRWANAIADQADVPCQLCVFGVWPPTGSESAFRSAIAVRWEGSSRTTRGRRRMPMRVVRAVPEVRSLIRRFRPHIVHAHYASSYGLLAALTGFRPLVLSVWGSDVFEFPRRSLVHRAILKLNLRRASRLTSTSRVMAREIRRYTTKPATVIPFGIDLNAFTLPPDRSEPCVCCVIGTAKALEAVYGIDTLIRSFALVRDMCPDQRVTLSIAGDGPEAEALKRLCEELHVDRDVRFLGRLPHREVPGFLQGLDIFVCVSRRESFGVAALEASACGRPVVASEAGGLPEVVLHGRTGLIVPIDSPQATAASVAGLVRDRDLRERLGREGRRWVEQEYNWRSNVAQMLTLYQEIQ